GAVERVGGVVGFAGADVQDLGVGRVHDDGPDVHRQGRVDAVGERVHDGGGRAAGGHQGEVAGRQGAAEGDGVNVADLRHGDRTALAAEGGQVVQGRLHLHGAGVDRQRRGGVA